jgi:hypothetical protein
MVKRSKRQQNKHDNAVKKSAEYYEKQNYSVDADIKGYNKPKTINGRRPDLIAKKGKKEIIVEVETSDSINKDIKQRQEFKDYANKSKNRRFWTKKTK